MYSVILQPKWLHHAIVLSSLTWFLLTTSTVTLCLSMLWPFTVIPPWSPACLHHCTLQHKWRVTYGTLSGDSTLHGLYMMAMTGNHTAMATADTVRWWCCCVLNCFLDSWSAFVLVCQVFLKHINCDGGLRNVEMKTKGPNVTPRAEDTNTDVAEAELLMTSGLLMIMISEGLVSLNLE